MKLHILLLCFCYPFISNSRANNDEEPTCLSRFDYEFKLVQKLAQIEREQKELQDIVSALRTTGTEKSNHQMAFSAQLTQTTERSTQERVIIFDHTTLNIGNGYDAEHGIFTALYHGLYFFSTTLSSKESANLWIVKNSQSYEYTFTLGTHWSTGSASISLELEPGDRVWVEAKGVLSGYNTYTCSSKDFKCYHTAFTGFLISTI